jgi:hypothetical protein
LCDDVIVKKIKGGASCAAFANYPRPEESVRFKASFAPTEAVFHGLTAAGA